MILDNLNEIEELYLEEVILEVSSIYLKQRNLSKSKLKDSDEKSFEMLKTNIDSKINQIIKQA